MQVNDILVSKWGYEQTNVDFYKVLKVTSSTVIIQELETIEQSDGDMTGWIMPIDKFKGKPLRRKLQSFNDEKFVYINKYSIAKKWNNQKERYTSYG